MDCTLRLRLRSRSGLFRLRFYWISSFTFGYATRSRLPFTLVVYFCRYRYARTVFCTVGFVCTALLRLPVYPVGCLGCVTCVYVCRVLRTRLRTRLVGFVPVYVPHVLHLIGHSYVSFCYLPRSNAPFRLRLQFSFHHVYYVYVWFCLRLHAVAYARCHWLRTQLLPFCVPRVCFGYTRCRLRLFYRCQFAFYSSVYIPLLRTYQLHRLFCVSVCSHVTFVTFSRSTVPFDFCLRVYVRLFCPILLRTPRCCRWFCLRYHTRCVLPPLPLIVNAVAGLFTFTVWLRLVLHVHARLWFWLRFKSTAALPRPCTVTQFAGYTAGARYVSRSDTFWFCRSLRVLRLLQFAQFG